MKVDETGVIVFDSVEVRIAHLGFDLLKDNKLRGTLNKTGFDCDDLKYNGDNGKLVNKTHGVHVYTDKYEETIGVVIVYKDNKTFNIRWVRKDGLDNTSKTLVGNLLGKASVDVNFKEFIEKNKNKQVNTYCASMTVESTKFLSEEEFIKRNKDKSNEKKTVKNEGSEVKEKNDTKITDDEVEVSTQIDIDELNVYSIILKTIKENDVVTVPLHIYNKLETISMKVIESNFSMTEYKTITKIRVDKEGEGNVLAIVDFKDKSNNVKVHILESYSTNDVDKYDIGKYEVAFKEWRRMNMTLRDIK